MSWPRPVPRSRTFTRALTFPVEQALDWELHAQRLHWVLIDRAEALLRARFPEQTRALPDCEGSVTVTGRRRPSFRVRLQFYEDRTPVYHSRETAPLSPLGE